jgi:hypothetical protein
LGAQGFSRLLDFFQNFSFEGLRIFNFSLVILLVPAFEEAIEFGGFGLLNIIFDLLELL